MDKLRILVVMIWVGCMIGLAGCNKEEAATGPAPASGAQGHEGSKEQPEGQGPSFSVGGTAGGGAAATTQ
jgi:hypothetical protein